jgi:hypothetical protein
MVTPMRHVGQCAIDVEDDGLDSHVIILLTGCLSL